MGDRSGLTFVVDTGTWPTLVDARIARQFRKGGSPVPVESFTRTDELERAVLDEPRRGEFLRRGRAGSGDRPGTVGLHFGIKADVVLGVEVLRGACFSVRRTLSFACRDDWRATLPLDRRSSLPIASVTIDGTPLRLRVDTGSPAAVVYDAAIPDGWRSRVHAEINAFDFSGPVRLRRFIADVIAVGPVTWHGRPVHILPAGVTRHSEHGVLGVRALGVSAVQWASPAYLVVSPNSCVGPDPASQGWARR